MHVRGANILILPEKMSNEEWRKFDKMMMERGNTVSQKDVDDLFSVIQPTEK